MEFGTDIMCNPDDPEFSVVFQDGTIINEEDIAFYDSSTTILFLNEKLYLDYGSEGYPLTDHFKFSVFVQNDTIFQGVVFPHYLYNRWVRISPVKPFQPLKVIFLTFRSQDI